MELQLFGKLFSVGRLQPEQLGESGLDNLGVGAQGDERITAAEWATRLGTIAYEITCGISARVPRTYLGTRP